MLRTTGLLSVCVACLALAACGRVYGPVEESKAFSEEKEAVLTEMAKKLAANPTEAGIDEARKVFEAKKESIKARKAAINAAPQGMNSDWRSVLMSIENRHDRMLSDMVVGLTAACGSEPCRSKMKALEDDFNASADFYR
jgi:hypothetical protein